MMEWVDNKIQIVPPKRPKKLTATRFATILGLNPWSTPFEVWCEITRTYQKPFEDTIYTIAGKTIEPKQAEYMKNTYFMTNLVTPTDIYGENYFQKTFGDFFSDTPVLGGMWDYLLHGKDGKPVTVLEMKTSKRVEDWADDIPEYYALQAALYAFLLGVDDVIMVASFLEPGDYEHPENFVCNPSNTITRPFKVSERYPDFEKRYVKPALKWWKDHVETGLSRVDPDKCTDCMACAKACPRHLITEVPVSKKVHVACANQDKGKAAMSVCTHSCIGCGLCQKECKKDAIHVVNGVAVIDYDKCVGCKLCTKVCPRDAILPIATAEEKEKYKAIKKAQAEKAAAAKAAETAGAAQ